jgi:hypothetical protein
MPLISEVFLHWARTCPRDSPYVGIQMDPSHLAWQMIESAENYVCLHAGGESGLLRETMNSLEARLQPAQFVRIHRALLVNATVYARSLPWEAANTSC